MRSTPKIPRREDKGEGAEEGCGQPQRFQEERIRARESRGKMRLTLEKPRRGERIS